MGCCLSTQRRVSSALPSSSGGGAGTAQDRAHADDSSRANIHDPAAASPPLLNQHSTQSFLTASISASDDSPALTPRLSSSSRTDVAHQPRPSAGGGAGAAARRWSRRLSRGSALPSTAASTGAASTTTTTPATRPNKPLVALDRARRCKGPVLDGGLVASPALSSLRHAHGRKGGVEGPRLTAARLERERDAFWDTRVTGRAEVWGAVRLAAEMVRAGDVASAQGVVDAVGATCPTGEVWRGVFDEWGAEYRVPEWVVVEPAGVVVEGESDEEDEEEEEGEGGLAEEKGKGRMGEMVKLRARLSDRGTDVVVQVGMEERVSAVVAKVGEAAKLAGTSRIRIAYLGKMLRENESLGAQGYSDGHVVNALVF